MLDAAADPGQDDAWRVHPLDSGVAHYYGSASHFDFRPVCEANLDWETSRPVITGDRPCPSCDGWYRLHATGPQDA